MGNFYVALTGDNGNVGSIGSPWATIAFGLGQIGANDTLHIRGGMYDEELDLSWPAGTSWSDAPTITAYQSEVVTIKPTTVSGTQVLNFDNSAEQYIILNKITIDATNSSQFAVSIVNAHHIRFTNCTITGAPWTGINTGSLTGGDLNEFIDCIIHTNGTSAGNNHGLYLAANGNLADGCTFYNNGHWGVHIFEDGGWNNDDNIVRNCTFYANGVNSSGGAILCGGDDTQIYNNVIYNETNSFGIDVGFSGTNNNTLIYNNTFHNCATAIQVESGVTGTNIRNNIFHDCTANVTDNGTSTTNSNNHTGEPTFVDEATDDYHLQSSSTAIDNGVDLSGVFTTDKDGNTRSGWDQGAYEFVGSGLEPEWAQAAGGMW